MKSWIKIDGGEIVRRVNGPHNMPTTEGWQEVDYPADQWKLAVGVLILKTQIELNADAQLKADERQVERQRVGNKVQTMLTEFQGGNSIPLRNFLTKIILRFRDLED